MQYPVTFLEALKQWPSIEPEREQISKAMAIYRARERADIQGERSRRAEEKEEEEVEKGAREVTKNSVVRMVNYFPCLFVRRYASPVAVSGEMWSMGPIYQEIRAAELRKKIHVVRVRKHIECGPIGCPSTALSYWYHRPKVHISSRGP